MKYSIYEASKSLGRINLNLGEGMHELISYWCRVTISEREIQNHMPHRHSFFELHMCLDGTGVYSVGEKTVTLSAGEYLLLPPSCTHRIVSEPDYFRKFVWGFAVKNVQTNSALVKGCVDGFVGKTNDEILTSLEVILKNSYYQLFGYYDVIKGQLSNIFANLVRGICDIKEQQIYKKNPSLIIEEIKNYIEDNLKLSPSTEEISIQFSRSAGSLDKMCLAECGITLSALKKKIQFEKVKSLLSETDYTLDTIADICGFADRFTMGKFFKKFEGMPPGEFRRSNRK